MNKLDYNKVNTEILLTFIQMETSRPSCNMEKVTELRNIIKQRRMNAARDLKRLLEVENTAQKLVTHHLKDNMGR